MRNSALLLVALALAPAVSKAMAEPSGRATTVAADLRLMNVTFQVSDMALAERFYTNGLGLRTGARIERAARVELQLAFPSGAAGILLVASKGPVLGESKCGSGRAILAVSDISSLKDSLERAGYALNGPVSDVPQYHVRVAHVQDPDGNELELVQMQQ